MSFKDLFRIKEFKKEIEDLKAKHVNEIKAYTTEISKLSAQLTEAEEVNKQVHNLLLKYEKQYSIIYDEFEKEPTSSVFYTNEYKTMFESYLNSGGHSEEEILCKFNELCNKESIYFKGIVSCIDFIRTKRNRKVSTEKQILKYILTEPGRDMLDSYIESIANRNSGEN